jgi:hypothetical protein
MALTPTRIIELSTMPKVRRVAVENFLSSLDGMTYQEAVGNCELDKRSYRWNDETSGAIREGLVEHYFGSKK